jgi:type I restriction enzyme S subunit
VAKVDELMALCDQLEAQQQERERRFPVLSRTCHARFTEAPTSSNINRIFDETGSVSPEDVRRSILTLAIQAKLVPQRLADGHAQKLYDRIQNDRVNYALATRLRTSHEEPINEPPYLLPTSWKWTRLSSLFNAVLISMVADKCRIHTSTNSRNSVVHTGTIFSTRSLELPTVVPHLSIQTALFVFNDTLPY